jgi:hypothetical protein
MGMCELTPTAAAASEAFMAGEQSLAISFCLESIGNRPVSSSKDGGYSNGNSIQRQVALLRERAILLCADRLTLGWAGLAAVTAAAAAKGPSSGNSGGAGGIIQANILTTPNIFVT